MNIYENGAGHTAALSADLAYYPVHGSFPSGVTRPAHRRTAVRLRRDAGRLT
ncbi:MAG TPA: hypothetical protein VGH77_13600 [Streptosporangiaceae bacterium]|jgi:hypothetical protein